MNVASTAPIKARTKTSMTMSWEHISPTRAKLWLANTVNTDFAQRGKSESSVVKYATDIQHGLWHEQTGVAIQICDFGGLEVCLDGQHRLGAIIRADEGIDAWVCRHVPEEAFKYVDGGRARDLKDVCTAAGLPAPRILSVVITNLYNHFHSGSPVIRPAADEATSAGNMLDWSGNYHPKLIGFWHDWEDQIRAAKRTGAGPESLFLYLYYQWMMIDSSLCMDWMTYMENPTMNTPAYAAMAIAYDYCRTIRAESKMKMGEYHNLTVECHIIYAVAWNSVREKRHIKTVAGLKKRVKEAAGKVPTLV